MPPLPAPAAAVAPPRPPPPTPAAPAQPPPPLPPPSPAAAAAPPPTLKAVGRGRPKAKALDNEQKNERENVQSEVSKGETEQGHHKDSTTGLVKGIKRPRKLKGSKHTPHTPDSHGATEGDAGPLFSSNNCRYDSSLGLLTKKFVNLLERAEDGTLDLNKAAETLEVQKRRIYDITNVLEGVDLIEKKLKNMIRWKGFDMSKPKEMERQTSVLKEEIESLYNEDSRLDDKIMEAQEKLQALMVDEEKRKWLYLSKEDINKIHRFQGSTLIAINAPHGTYVEVPDPIADLDFLKDLDLQERHYQILLRSSMGPIDCYLISDHQETCNTDQMAPDNLDPVVATGSSQVLQQVDYDPSQAQEEGENNAVGKPTSQPSRTHEFMAGILRIVPSDADIDADYWLASDDDVSMTDTWAT